MNYYHNIDFGDDFNDFQGFNFSEEDQEQTENFQSYSRYFINDNNTNHEKLLNKKRKRGKIFDIKKIPKKKFRFGRMGKLDNIYETINFIKFQTKFIANLKKDKNIDLLEAKLVDILKNQKISTKNKRSNEYQNSIIIDKIYEEKKEERVMKILELEFKELFIIFRRKLNKPEDEKELKKIAKKIEGLDLITNDDYDDTKYLIDDIEKQNSKNNRMNETELEEYIEKVKECCKNYEKWFYDKIEKTKKIK